MFDGLPYRGPILSIRVDQTLGRRPDGRLMRDGKRGGYWWSCGCEVRGSEPFAVVRGCEQHASVYAEVPGRALPSDFQGETVREPMRPEDLLTFAQGRAHRLRCQVGEPELLSDGIVSRGVVYE